MLLYTDAELQAIAKQVNDIQDVNKQDRKPIFRIFLDSLTNLPSGQSSNNDIHIFFKVEGWQFNLWPTTMRAYQQTSLERGRHIIGAYEVLKALNELNGEV